MKSDEAINIWLRGLGLEAYFEQFSENFVTVDLLPSLTAEDLTDIGVTAVGHRRKMLNAIADLRAGTATVEQESFGTETLGVLPEAARRQVTVLFADISGFTELSNASDAETIHGLLNHYFDLAGGVITGYGGSVDKHLGDSVMAVFGAPITHTDDPERALRAALDIHRQVARMEPPVMVHIGIAAGQVIASSTGGAAHAEFTVTGASVNLASRLTDLAGPGETFVSASVQRALGPRLDGEALGERLVEGFPEPMVIWQARGLKTADGGQNRPMVGRLPELRLFQDVLARCSEQDRGETLIIRGEPGIGKTRLLEEFAKLASEKGYSVQAGQVLDFGTARGQDAIGNLAKRLLGISVSANAGIRGQSANDAILSGLVPSELTVFLYDILSLTQLDQFRAIYDAMNNETRTQGRHEAFAAIVKARSKEMPLLLTVEDIHWGDPQLLAHLAEIVMAVGQCRAVLVMTTRVPGDPLSAGWRASAGAAPLSEIDLERMGIDEARDLSSAYQGIHEDFLVRCLERSSGNPLFLDQLLANADEGGRDDMPDTVQAIVQARLDGLPAMDRRALQAASVLGQRFIPTALANLLDDEDFDAKTLTDQGLIRSVANGHSFAHALFREGAYASLLKTQRRELHERAAKYFEENDPALCASHLAKAEHPEAAAAYLSAARQLYEALRYDAALELLDRGVELPSDKSIGLELSCFHGDLLRELGRAEESIAAFKAASSRAMNSIDRFYVQLGRAEGLRVLGRHEEGLELLEGLEHAITEDDDQMLRVRLHHLRGNLCFPMGKLDECLAAHQTALAIAREEGDEDWVTEALSGVGDAYYQRGWFMTSLEYFDQCIASAKQRGKLKLEITSLFMRAVNQVYCLNYHEAHTDANAAIEGAAKIRDTRNAVVTRTGVFQLLYDTDNLAELKQQVDIAFGLAIRTGMRSFLAEILLYKAHCLAAEGDYSGAKNALENALQIANETGPGYIGGAIFGESAILAENDDEMKAMLVQGEALLETDCVSHNYMFFYRAAIDASLKFADWAGAGRYADAMLLYLKDEPMPWGDYFAARGHALARAGRNGVDAKTKSELERLRLQATEVGLKSALPAIDAALN